MNDAMKNAQDQLEKIADEQQRKMRQPDIVIEDQLSKSAKSVEHRRKSTFTKGRAKKPESEMDSLSQVQEESEADFNLTQDDESSMFSGFVQN